MLFQECPRYVPPKKSPSPPLSQENKLEDYRIPDLCFVTTGWSSTPLNKARLPAVGKVTYEVEAYRRSGDVCSPLMSASNYHQAANRYSRHALRSYGIGDRSPLTGQWSVKVRKDEALLVRSAGS